MEPLEPESDAGVDAAVDEIVARLRRGRDETLIPVLHQRVLALPRWFFLADPADPGGPLRMTFEGRDDMPAVLVFTSRDKAIHCARERSIADDAGRTTVRTAPVPSAIRWLVDHLRPHGIVYARFNLEGLDFPVYIDQLDALWRDLGPAGR